MAIATATPPSSTATAAPVVESIVAAYKTHEEAKAAVRKLEKAGVPIALMAMGLSKDEALKYQCGSRRVNFWSLSWDRRTRSRVRVPFSKTQARLI